jgi:hypothetical protein
VRARHRLQAAHGFSSHSVLRVTAGDPNRDALLELATYDGTRLTMAQSYT